MKFLRPKDFMILATEFDFANKKLMNMNNKRMGAESISVVQAISMPFYIGLKILGGQSIILDDKLLKTFTFICSFC